MVSQHKPMSSTSVFYKLCTSLMFLLKVKGRKLNLSFRKKCWYYMGVRYPFKEKYKIN